MTTVWYKQVNPSQRKALFSAWLGYVFDGFDFMMIFYILHIIKADLGITDIQATLIGTVAFIARPIGGGLFGAMADKYGRKPMMMWQLSFIQLEQPLAVLLQTYICSQRAVLLLGWVCLVNMHALQPMQ